MRPRLQLASALLLIATACGGPAGPGADGVGVEASAATSPTVQIDIDGAESFDPPDAPVAPARVATTASTIIVGDASSTPDGSSASSAGSDGGAASTSTAATDGAGSPSSTSGPTSTADDGSAPPAGSTGARSSVVAQAVVPQIVARVEPSDDAAPVASLAHPTAVGSPLVFLAVEGSAPVGWLQVRLPVQPNGTTGWVRRDEVTLFENPYRIEIDRAEHRLQVFHLGEPWLETSIAVGTGSTPTPVGDFYLLELLAPPDPTGPYGPYAFGLSGFSEVLDSFGGADTAIIGLHGTDQPEALGTDVSFGCIRLANEVMEQLATTLPLGTPVRIV